jgi:O-antigen/teichoic acid export membrane protein
MAWAPDVPEPPILVYLAPVGDWRSDPRGCQGVWNHQGWTPRNLAGRVARSKVATNVAWNYAGVAWTAGLNFLTLPLYLRLLGKAEWGLVAVCVTVQSVLALLDVGFGQIMPKDVAEAHGDPEREGRTLGAFLWIYLFLGFVGFTAGQFLAGTLARRWFQAPDIASGQLELALRLVLVQFVFQFANNAHIGYWSGTQLQRTANQRQVVFATLRHAAALCSVAFLSRSAIAYILPFAAVTAIEWVANRRKVLAEAGYPFWRGPPADLADVLAIVKEARGFAFGILVGLLVTQLDRIVLSRTQDITSYGIYVIVASAGLAFLNLQYPLLRAFLPRIVRERASGASGGPRALRQLLLSVLALCVAPCLLVAAFARRGLELWLRNPSAAEVGASPLRLILWAVALNAIYNVIYQVMLAEGRSRLVIGINLSCLAVALAVTWLVGPSVGIVLGGIIWLSSTATQLALGAGWVFLRAKASRLPRAAEERPA